MIPVFQTRYGDKHGNCYQACLASLLEIGLDEVPDFCQTQGHWQGRANQWLRTHFGLSTLTISYDRLSKIWNAMDGVYCLLSGPNLAGVNHSTVGQLRMRPDGLQEAVVIHNPNDTGLGDLAELRQVDLFLIADPARPLRRMPGEKP